MSNTLFYGDNLPVLSQHRGDAVVDLCDLAPPFNSSKKRFLNAASARRKERE